jgi:hypothetical protein
MNQPHLKLDQQFAILAVILAIIVLLVARRYFHA